MAMAIVSMTSVLGAFCQELVGREEIAAPVELQKGASSDGRMVGKVPTTAASPLIRVAVVRLVV